MSTVTLALVVALFSGKGATYCTNNFDGGDVKIVLEFVALVDGVDALLTIGVSLSEFWEGSVGHKTVGATGVTSDIVDCSTLVMTNCTGEWLTT